jgi:predicted DCC family thiol-disulfide oxidoreductase YuxK
MSVQAEPRMTRDAAAASTTEPPLVLFDGCCNLCNGAVQFIIARDPHARFRFAALDAPAAVARLARIAPVTPLPDSVLLLDADGLHARSEAALRIARQLTTPWPLLARVARLVPRALRDRVYDLVARNRLRWFGRRDACMVPTPALQSRFLT